jgi:hypothetical protein
LQAEEIGAAADLVLQDGGLAADALDVREGLGVGEAGAEHPHPWAEGDRLGHFAAPHSVELREVLRGEDEVDAQACGGGDPGVEGSRRPRRV